VQATRAGPRPGLCALRAAPAAPLDPAPPARAGWPLSPPADRRRLSHPTTAPVASARGGGLAQERIDRREQDLFLAARQALDVLDAADDAALFPFVYQAGNPFALTQPDSSGLILGRPGDLFVDHGVSIQGLIVVPAHRPVAGRRCDPTRSGPVGSDTVGARAELRAAAALSRRPGRPDARRDRAAT